MAEHIETFKGWAETIRQDIEAYKALLASTTADDHSKKLAGAALLYLVSRMDLIPDWNPGIGVIDDIMVLRVCAQLTQSHERGNLPTQAEVSLDRMANQCDTIKEFLGAALFDKLKAHCAKLGEASVRGRTPAQLAADATLRKALDAELDDEIQRSVPIVVTDAKDAEMRLRSYLSAKLA